MIEILLEPKIDKKWDMKNTNTNMKLKTPPLKNYTNVPLPHQKLFLKLKKKIMKKLNG